MKAKVLLLLSTLICIILFAPMANAFELSPKDPVVGDMLTISGVSERQSEQIIVEFSTNVDVVNGKYEYRLPGKVEIPSGENRFQVMVEGVEDLNVRGKLFIWIPISSDANNGVATKSLSNVPSGNYEIKIDGNAMPGKSTVKLTINARQTVDVVSGAFHKTYLTNSIPAGTFTITAAGETRTIELRSSSTDSGYSSGGGSTGPGGAGISMSPDREIGNVLVHESDNKRAVSGMATEYLFKNPEVPIRSINLTSKITASSVPISVEVLKDTSSMARVTPGGLVYKNLNIWVGHSGFKENVRSADIIFEVDNNWLKEHNISTDAISLSHYNREQSSWIALDTQMLFFDDEKTFYVATTTDFSPFAISAEQASIPPEDNLPVIEHIQEQPSPDAEQQGYTRYVFYSLLAFVFVAMLLIIAKTKK